MTQRILAVCVALCTVTAALVAQAPAPAKPNAEMKKLDALLGTWTYAGDAAQSPFGPAGKITGTETFTSMSGGFFVEDRWDEKNPLGGAKGLQMWGYDPAKKAFTYTYFSSLGESGSGTITISGNTWSWHGTGVTYEGKPAHGRGTMTFTGAGAYTVVAEASADGKIWARSFEGKWTKGR